MYTVLDLMLVGSNVHRARPIVTVSSVSQLLVDRTVYRARCQVHGLPHQCHSVISVTVVG